MAVFKSKETTKDGKKWFCSIRYVTNGEKNVIKARNF